MSALHQPEAARASSLSEEAYYRLRELIVTLALAPGSALDERGLMARLALGRTPIREALQALARDGLVEVFPRRGIFVSRVEVGDLAGLSELRAELEGFAARLAAARRTAADLAQIVALLAELDAVVRDERRLIELDQRLHRCLWSCARNPFLAATLEQHYVLTLRIWFLALDRVARLDDAVGEHRALLTAIRDGDGAAAEDAARRHVAGFEQAIRAVL